MDPLEPRRLLLAYATGIFPMADGRDAADVYWVEPQRRAVLPLHGFHLARSLRRTIAADRFHVTADRAFEAAIALCAEAADDRPDTWINPGIADAFVRLHRLGFAHSIECWAQGRLVGGLYGLALGRAFFGESMVSRATDASKVALAWLVARLRVGGFSLLDCQFQTAHLASLGAVEIDRAAYLVALAEAVSEVVVGSGASAAGVGSAADFFALDRGEGAARTGSVSGPVDGKLIVQLLAQTS